MNLIQKLQKLTGLILAVPLLVMAITGLFLIPQPKSVSTGNIIELKKYPITRKFTIIPHSFWQSYSVLRTVLGYHLIVKTDTGYVNLDPVTFEKKNKPNEEFLRALVNDALSINRHKFGTVVKTDGVNFVTNTGFKLKLDWNKLEIIRKTRPRTFRNLLLRIHRFEWTGDKQIDRGLIFATGLLAMIFSLLTIWSLFTTKRKK